MRCGVIKPLASPSPSRSPSVIEYGTIGKPTSNFLAAVCNGPTDGPTDRRKARGYNLLSRGKKSSLSEKSERDFLRASEKTNFESLRGLPS